MKICHLISSIDKGGAETHLYTLVKKQKLSGDEVIVIYLKGNSYWKKYYKKIGVKTFKINFDSNLNLLKFLIAIFKINSIIKIYNPYIVHSHLTVMELIGALIKKFLNKKFCFIITKHLDSYFLEASFGKKKFFKGILFEKFILTNAEKIICISNQVKKYFYKIINKKITKFKVIYYGFSFERYIFSKDHRKIILKFKKKHKIKKNDFIICNIARHVKQKSLGLLIKSFNIYNKENTNSKLILIGNGPENKKLKNLAKDLKIYEKIIWIDSYENIKDIISLSNLFILSSKYEGLGLVLLEAMASKKPILATKISAIPEVVKHNYSGILVDHGHPRKISKKIKLFENKKLSMRYGNNGFKILNTKFNVNRMYIETNRAYIEVIKNAKRKNSLYN